MLHAFYICIIIVALTCGFLVGSVTEVKRRTIGRLIINANDGSKELFELHITNDINLKAPPRQVVLDLSIPEGSE